MVDNFLVFFNEFKALFLSFVIAIISFSIISRYNLIFKQSESKSASRIRELESQLQDLIVTVKGNDEIVGVVDSLSSMRGKMSSLNSLELSDEAKENIEKEVNDIVMKTIKEKVNSAEIKKPENTDKLTEYHKSFRNVNFEPLSEYSYLLDDEYRNSIGFKAILINLFVVLNVVLLVTISLLAFFYPERFQGGSSPFPYQISLTISGVYISFSAFIIYVVRFSNARSLTILALREDFSRRDILDSAAMQLVKKEDLNESDVALMKALMLNRAHREQNSSHPYEILLQGISGSNIQFQGGKLNVGKSKD